MREKSEAFDPDQDPKIDLIPSLAAITAQGLDPKNLTVAIKIDPKKRQPLTDRHSIVVTDSEKTANWTVPSLRELFRGGRLPPADMDHYPEEYAPCFFFIENYFLGICNALGDRTDQEMEEIYSALRGRPDGRSLGLTHDLMW